jgi:hypothetical protein
VPPEQTRTKLLDTHPSAVMGHVAKIEGIWVHKSRTESGSQKLMRINSHKALAHSGGEIKRKSGTEVAKNGNQKMRFNAHK